MGQLSVWMKKVSRWCSKTNVPSVDESQATESPEQRSKAVESGQASLAIDLSEQKSEAVDSGQTSHVTDLAKHPVWFLNRATECMERVHQMTSELSDVTEVKRNHKQCKFLSGELKTAVGDCRESYSRSSSPEHQAECLETLKLLYQLAKEVESFIQDCCKDDMWMQAAITSASVPVRVSALGCYLKLCTLLLYRATKCVERAHRMTSGLSDFSEVKRNHKQCKFLSGELKTAVGDCRKSYSRSSSPEHQAECLETLKLLYRLAKEVESFIQACCEDDMWMQAAITSASVPVRVSSLGCYLKLCTSLLRHSNKLGAAWLTWIEHEGLREAELVAVQKMASSDEETLLSLLESLTLPSSSKSIDQFQQATILLERLKATQACSSAGSRQSLNLGLWKVDEMSLERSRVVGRGSSTTVHKAKWLGAVEVAQKEWSMKHPGLENEVSLFAKLLHPNILSLLGYTSGEWSSSIVTELMDGDLNLLMQQIMQEDKTRMAPFSISVACDIMLQVAEGVHYMHQNGVVHRDLKSPNILVRSSKDQSSKGDDVEFVCAKVGNFKFAKTKDRNITFLHPTFNTGTTRWIAPELIRVWIPGSDVSRTGDWYPEWYPYKSDVYSFGVVCYEILTGDLPFANNDPLTIQRNVLSGQRPVLPGQCPQDLKNLIELCWDPVPNTRPSFAKICEELRFIKCSLLLEPSDQTDQPALPIPKALDLPKEVSRFKKDYSTLKVEKQLGKGGSDTVTVYLTTWHRPEGHQTVAQKRFIGSRNKCFKNEVSILAGLKHDNIIRLLCYASDRRSCSIVMELMDEDLHDLIMDQRRLKGDGTFTFPFSIDIAVDIMIQIARGMQYIHQKRIVHRDLKSWNILIKKRGNTWDVKVADFGLSVKMGGAFLSKASAVGTVRWMAPEIVMSLKEDPGDMQEVISSQDAKPSNYDPFKSDVYSFGMVCYEILTGKVPFSDMENLTEVKQKVHAGERPLLPQWTPPNLKDLVEKCWQENASGRPSFAEIIEELTES